MTAFTFTCRFSYLAFAGLLAASAARAQDTPVRRTPVYPPPAPLATDTTSADQVGRSQEFAVPSVLGMGPSKGLVLHYERLADYSIKTTEFRNSPDVNTNHNTTVTKNARAFVKAYAPLINHPHLKVVLGVNYDREEFNFKDPAASSLYRNLEEKGLKVLGAQLAVIRPVDEVHWYIARVKGELNGDYTSGELTVPDYLKMSAEFIYGWKRTPNFAWGVGAQLGYTFGRQSIYPVILYNRTWNSHWGVESLFPARVSFRYNLTRSTLLYAGYTVDGYNYNIKLREQLDNGLQTLIVRQNEIKPRLRLEREIYDFLWFGLEGGYRYNASFNALDETNNKGFSLFRGSARNLAVDNTLGGAPYASLELFIVPPRKFLNKTASK
ncbi:hypothetical protein F0P96_10735 [Hymenobacter busanensis]|uniref:DUF6268 domain-containing protein n=1 Tax=Hymenobacter busanensis TaxID=2607656 RepID=A0A7L4ZX93_9BACT|nr:DUF6268 family outer membrane beta-barrel protein [Hymenobacter busanensis]KAA9333436.1 hypothetical protein F0P96_10735 [Hymenobacter busanensis]QHJ07881.1 hypothetical protein GUY19_11555 [Hymenobacter busanensis]